MNPFSWPNRLWNWIKKLQDRGLFDGFASWGGWTYVTPLLAFLAVAALTAYQQLAKLLQMTHLPAAASYGPNSLANLGFHPPDSSIPGQAVKTWADAQVQAPADVHGPERILHWAMYVDWGFLVVYSLLLALWLIKVGGALRVAKEDQSLITTLATRRVGSTTEDDPTAAGERIKKLIGAYRLIVAIALLAIPVIAIADVLENLFILRVYASPDRDFWWLWTFAVVKTLFFALVVFTALIATVALISFRWTSLHRVVGTLVAMRFQILLGVLFGALMLFDPTGQAQDSIRRWEPHRAQAVVPFLLILVFGLLIAVDARRLLGLAQESLWPGAGYNWKCPAGLIAGGLATIGIGAFTDWKWDAGLGLMVLGGIAAAIGILSAFVARLPPDDPILTLGTARRLTALLAVFPALTLGVAAFRASFSEMTYAQHREYTWLVASALAYQFVAWGLYPLMMAVSKPRVLGLRLRLVLLAGVAAFVVGVVMSPWSFAPPFGTLGVLAVFMLAATLASYCLAWTAEHIRPPQAFTLLRLRRIPIIVLLLLWAILAAQFDRSGSYYDARIIKANPDHPEICNVDTLPATLKARMACHALTASDVLADWMKRNAPPAAALEEAKPAVPLIFVAAEGGGIRAAYWTAIALRCVLEGIGADACGNPSERGERVFAASGVSGGALGLVTYATHVANDVDDPTWPQAKLDHDFLAPTVAWGLFVDLPFAFIRRDGGTDRAEVLERAWQDGWGPPDDKSPLAAGLYEQWGSQPDRGPHLPLLFLNGTRVQDGCRFQTSVVITSVGSGPDGSPVADPNPRVRDCLSLRLFEKAKPNLYVSPVHRSTWTLGATTDLADNLCREDDVRLSTAALLSARFPLVTPSGRLQRCGGGSPVNIVDGGYFETSGTSTIVEVWESLRATVAENNSEDGQTCVVPVLLEIDNHYASAPGPTPAGRPWESLVPIKTLGGGRDAREAQARQAAAIAFGQASFDGWTAHAGSTTEPVDRIAHIFPRAHPGTQAPLGWTLSDSAEEDLDDRLARDNNEELEEKIGSWFASDLVCRRA